MSAAVVLRPATTADADRIAYVFTVSRRTAMPWLLQHHTAEEDRAWVEEVLLPTRSVTVAERNGYVLAYAATEDGWLTDLYVDPAAQGQGVGSALFAHAQSQQPRGFDIWAFQRNTPVLDFYARYGCVEVERTDGATNMEREPDVRLRWRPEAERP